MIPISASSSPSWKTAYFGRVCPGRLRPNGGRGSLAGLGWDAPRVLPIAHRIPVRRNLAVPTIIEQTHRQSLRHDGEAKEKAYGHIPKKLVVQ